MYTLAHVLMTLYHSLELGLKTVSSEYVNLGKSDICVVGINEIKKYWLKNRFLHFIKKISLEIIS